MEETKFYDHLGNEYPSIKDIISKYKISKEKYRNRVYRWDIIETLEIIPRINIATKNAFVFDLIVLKYAYSYNNIFYFEVIKDGECIIMTRKEILDYAYKKAKEEAK